MKKKKLGRRYTKTMNIWDFNEKISNHISFYNMGIILKLRGGDCAFYYKGQFYEAYHFPNFGSQTIQFWPAKEPKI